MFLNEGFIILFAYLSGSINAAIIVCRLFALPDPREAGSSNPGATNVYRLGGYVPAAMVFLFDVAKGTIPVWGAYFYGLNPIMLGVVALAACLGHIFPVFFHFKGGKAVATAFGAILPIGFSLSVALIFTWIVAAKVTRYSSLAALITVCLAPLYTWFIKPVYTLPVCMLAMLIVLRHQSNIVRLIKGREPKIDQKLK